MAEVGTVYVSVMPKTKGFAAALKGAGGPAGAAVGRAFSASFGKIVGGSALGNTIAAGIGKGVSVISSSLDSAFARADTLNTYPKTMRAIGYATEEADASIASIKDHLDGLPSKTQDLASFVKSVASAGGTLGDATDVGLAFNDMLLAASASETDAQFSMQAFSKMLAGGKAEADNWMTLMQAMPGQMNMVAASLLGAGKNGWDLQAALKDGTVTFDAFKGAIVKAAKEGGDGFEAFEVTARSASGGIQTSLGLIPTRISNAVANVVGHIGVDHIAGVIDSFSSRISAAGDLVIKVYDGMASKVDIEGIGSAFEGFIGSVSGALSEGDAAISFGEALGSALNGLIPLLNGLAGPASVFAGAVRAIAENASWALPLIAAFVLGVKGVGIIGSIAPQLPVFGRGAAAAGTGAAQSVPQLLAMGAAALMVGAGIALACAGVALLAYAAVTVAQAGTPAIAVLVGLVAAVALLAAGAVLLGPALTAGSVGLIAFGTAIALVGAGIFLASAGLALVAAMLPLIAAYGEAGAGALIVLAASLVVFGAGAIAAGAGAIVAGAGLIVLGAGAVVGAAGVIVLGAGLMVAAAGLTLCAAAVALLAAGIMVCAAGCAVMGASLPMVAAAAPAAAAGLAVLAGGALASMVGIGAATPVVAAFAAACAEGGGGAQAMAGGIAASQAQAAALAAALMAAAAAAPAAGSRIAASGAMLGTSMSAGCTAAKASMESALAAYMAMASAIAGRVLTARVEIEMGPLPHFSMDGRFDAKAGTVPTIDVNWYGGGGVFRHPAIIGVGEAGEEVVESTDRLMDRIRSAVADGGKPVKQENYIFDGVVVDSTSRFGALMRQTAREAMIRGRA